MDYLDKIVKIEKQINEDKINRAKLEEKQKMLKEEKEKLLSELKSFNIEESELEDEIKKLEDLISTQIEKVEALLGN